MKREMVRRLPHRDTEHCASITLDSRHANHAVSAIPPKYPAEIHRKEGRSRSPSVLVLAVFVAMCCCSAYYVAKIMQLSHSISRASIESKWVRHQSKYPRTQTQDIGIGSSERLGAIISEVQSILKQPVYSCQTFAKSNGRSYESNNLCPAQQEDHNSHVLIYNPSSHDKFLCKGKIILGPKKYRILTTDNLEECWVRPSETLLLAHSFPAPPTPENKDIFPGIVVKSTSNEREYDDTFSSNYVSKRTMLASKDPSSPECDVKCDFEGLARNHQHRYIYGTNWEFVMSMEGEQYYSDLKMDANAWKDNKYYGTTSFKSEVPLPYFSFAEYNIQSPAVSFQDGIKGASFLARNCQSKNDRENVVQQLMKTGFRVDALSSCLNNVANPGFDLDDKGNVMRKYLFHLAFENQNTVDYITEKLWGTLSSGTIPVYFGAPNAKQHIPFNGVIFVNDFKSIESLAEHLIKVSNDQNLYETYHSWRDEPLPQEFINKYNISHTHSKCRTCRWAHAKKYGLGWNHTHQSIEPVFLPREACMKANHLSSPAMESWSMGDLRSELKLTNNGVGQPESLCPLPLDYVARARVGDGGLQRSVWSHDGTSDLLIEGEVSGSYKLNLAFPMKHHGALHYAEPNILWIQDNKSRISLAFKSNHLGDQVEVIKNVVTAASGVFEIRIDRDMLPLRVRVIVENLDTIHLGSGDEPSYYGLMMSNDIIEHPHLLSIAGETNLEEKPDKPSLQLADLHKKGSHRTKTRL